MYLQAKCLEFGTTTGKRRLFTLSSTLNPSLFTLSFSNFSRGLLPWRQLMRAAILFNWLLSTLCF